MASTLRKDPVVSFAARPDPGPLKQVVDLLTALFGKVTALVDIAMLLEVAGYTVTNAATAPGTSLDFTRTWVNWADAGIDNIRLCVRGNNSGAGTVTVSLYDLTRSLTLATVVLTGATPTTYPGSWTTIKPDGNDSELELRCIGDGSADPILYSVHIQGRTVQART